MINHNPALRISSTKLLIGIFLGLWFAFAVYALMYVAREALRIGISASVHQITILSKDEIDFYNLFYALIACIMGQSVCISFLVKTRKRIWGHRNINSTKILNDQSVMNWYFANWFAKLSMIFVGVFSAFGGAYVFSLYPGYKSMFVLMVLVLFLHSWINIRRIFKRKSWKWCIISIISISIISYGFSKIQLINYKAINHLIINENPYYKYEIDVPVTKTFSRLENKNLVKDIYVGIDTIENKTDRIVYFMDGNEVSLLKLSNNLSKWVNNFDYYDIPRLASQLHIDKKIEMENIERLVDTLRINGIFKVGFAITPFNNEFDPGYYREDYSLILKFPFKSFPNCPPPPPQLFPRDKKNRVEIGLGKNSKYSVNDSIINNRQLIKVLHPYYLDYKNYILKIKNKNELNFGQYLKIIDDLMQILEELRDKESLKQFNCHYVDLDEDRRHIINRLINIDIE